MECTRWVRNLARSLHFVYVSRKRIMKKNLAQNERWDYEKHAFDIKCMVRLRRHASDKMHVGTTKNMHLTRNAW